MIENNNQETDNTPTPTLSVRICKIMDTMKNMGCTEAEIIKEIDAEVSKVWEDKNNYVTFNVSLPKELYNEILYLHPKHRAAIDFFHNGCGACEACKKFGPKDPNYSENLTDEELRGHLLVEGSNGLIERHIEKLEKIEEREAIKSFEKLLRGPDNQVINSFKDFIDALENIKGIDIQAAMNTQADDKEQPGNTKTE